MHGLTLSLDLEALAHNLAHLKSLAGPGQHFIASIKANAYGHDAVRIAQALETQGVHSLATGSLAEARAIRAAGVELPILMFAASSPDQLETIVRSGFVPTLTDLDGARTLSGALDSPAPVYVKIDIGFGRLGIPHTQALEDLERLDALPNLEVVGLYTHAPFGNAETRAWSRDRLAAFDRLLGELASRGLRYTVTQGRASGCLLSGFTDTANAVCVGHALYGLNPFGPELRFDQQLRPVIAALSTRLLQVTHHGQGADLGVAGEFGIPSARTIGVLPVGRGDGLSRPGKERAAYVSVNGVRARVLAVSLEHTTIELPAGTECQPGDPVFLVGGPAQAHLDLADFAAWGGLSQLDAIMGISGRAALAPQH